MTTPNTEVAELRALLRAALARLDRLELAADAPSADTVGERPPSDEAFAKVAKRRARRRRG